MIPLSERRIVRAIASEAAERLCRQAVAALQKMRHTMSGDDSGLSTTWDEICVQVQDEQSMFWDAYESAIHDSLGWPVAQLATYERDALWLQTPEGFDWECRDDARTSDEEPVNDHDIICHLVREHVLRRAGEWSNPRIRAFLDQRM